MLMALPGIVHLFVFSYLPMPGLLLAFKDYKFARGIWGSAWVGLRNFQFLFATGDAWRIIFNTLFLNTLFILTTLVGALTMAVLLHEIYHRYVAKIYQSILFFPHFNRNSAPSRRMGTNQRRTTITHNWRAAAC